MRALTLRLACRLQPVQLPVLCLIALLQRVPVLRWLLVSESAWLNASMGQVLRSGALVTLAAGAVDTLAGATTFTANPASPASGTVGTDFTAAFAVTGAPSAVKAYTVTGLPPGLTVPTATLSGGTYTLNASTGSITGVPTTAGSYKATVTAWEKTGATGNNKAYSYTITVTGPPATPPAITTQPASQTVNAGAAVTFGVTATGTAPLAYQWQKGGTAIAGATAASYSIAAAAAGDAGSYTVVVTNAAGSVTSGAATLTVNTPPPPPPAGTAPSITSQPASQTVNAGSAVSFNVTASGTAPLSYQWQKGAAAIAGATSASYAIVSAATGDAGSYTVVVTNASGSATSNAATLTVNAAPVVTAPAITTQPVSQTVNTGTSVTFSVTATGTAPLTYQWRKGGTAIAGATGASFNLASAAAGDAGSYTVVVTNAAGSVTSDAATLTVNANNAPTAPTITGQPASQTVTAGTAVSFTVAVSGSAPFTYQWKKGGASIAGATDASYALAAAAAGDAGSYTVVVTNAAGSATSTAATLTVNAAPVTPAGTAPTITAQPASQTVTAGNPVSFSVSATGTAPLAYQWRRNGAALAGATAAIYAIAAATLDHAGTYSVVVTNGTGSVTSADATLVVNATAPAPGGPGTQPATTAALPFPSGISIDAGGTLYVTDSTGNNVHRVTPAGVVALLAGAGGSAGSADGTGTAATFNQPGGVVWTTGGTVCVADTANATIRRITSAGAVTTFAGAASARGAADGTGAAATFSDPVGLALDAAGNLYVADSGNNTIRKITPDAVVTTYAGAAGQAGSVDGTRFSARFNHPAGVAVDAAGNVYVADTLNDTIRRISPSGIVTTVAGVTGISGIGDGPGASALFNQPAGVAVDAAGNLLVADTGNNTIRRITPAGVVSTLAGLPTVAGREDGTGMAALFNRPRALTVDAAGNLYVADSGNAALRKVTPAGVVTTLVLSQAATTGGTTGGSGATGNGTSGGTASGGTTGASSGGGGGGGAPSPWFVTALALLALSRRQRRQPSLSRRHGENTK